MNEIFVDRRFVDGCRNCGRIVWSAATGAAAWPANSDRRTDNRIDRELLVQQVVSRLATCARSAADRGLASDAIRGLLLPLVVRERRVTISLRGSGRMGRHHRGNRCGGYSRELVELRWPAAGVVHLELLRAR